MYADPQLKKKAVMLQFAARMWRAKMLRGIPTICAEAGMFTVVKKVLENGDHEQRLIFDLRRGNQHWRKPPGFRWAAPLRSHGWA